jgi:hypothetical protein
MFRTSGLYYVQAVTVPLMVSMQVSTPSNQDWYGNSMVLWVFFLLSEREVAREIHAV